MADRKEPVGSVDPSVGDTQRELRDLRSKMAARDAEVEALNAALASKEATIRRLEATLQERTHALRTGTSDLAIRDDILTELQARVQRLEAGLASFNDTVAEREIMIRDLQRKVYEQGQTLRAGSADLDLAERTVVDLRARARALEAAFADERSSTRHIDESRVAVADHADRAAEAGVDRPWQRQIGDAISSFRARFGREPAVLDWNSGLELSAALPSGTVFSPLEPTAATLPHIDRSVDVVVCAETATTVQEARRVATALIVAIGRSSPSGGDRARDAGAVDVRLEWIGDRSKQP